MAPAVPAARATMEFAWPLMLCSSFQWMGRTIEVSGPSGFRDWNLCFTERVIVPSLLNVELEIVSLDLGHGRCDGNVHPVRLPRYTASYVVDHLFEAGI